MGKSSSKAVLRTSLKKCTLWKADRSPACRAVMMALDAMNMSLEEVDVNMEKSEHRFPDMTKMNPLQTLPVFKDKKMILYESHAICLYLASRYCVEGECAKLYPLDPGRRAMVHQQMFYNCGVLYPRYRLAADSILYDNCNSVMPQQVIDIESAYEDLENCLGCRVWFGGSWPTLGDITLGSTLSTLHCLVPIDPERFPGLSTWLCRLSTEHFYITANQKGLEEFVQRIDCCGDLDCGIDLKCPRSSERRRFLRHSKNQEA